MLSHLSPLKAWVANEVRFDRLSCARPPLPPLPSPRNTACHSQRCIVRMRLSIAVAPRKQYGRAVSTSARAKDLDPSHLPPFVKLILGEMGSNGNGYARFVLSNAESLRRGDKAFVARVYEEDVSYLCRPYVEKSRQMLCASMSLSLRRDGTRGDAAALEQVLAEFGLAELYSPEPPPSSGTSGALGALGASAKL